MNAAQEFCRRSLAEVSRTFALNIPMLPAPLDMAVTVAYLLCRVADTLEDEGKAPLSQRADLFADFSALVDAPAGTSARAKVFAAELTRSLRDNAPAAEVRLVQNLDLVLEALETLPARMHPPIARCVREMTRGMMEVMSEATDKSAGLPDLAATRLYCYYVAGVVGEMLTALFAEHSPSIAQVGPELGQRAVAFGSALQLTNILKDIREDLERGSCWLPRDRMAAHGLTAKTLLVEENRGAAVALLNEMVDVASADARIALDYALTLPPHEPQLRLFCLLPLFFAVLTLRALRGNPLVFSSTPVKISRAEVRRVMALTVERVAADTELRDLFDSLSRL